MSETKWRQRFGLMGCVGSWSLLSRFRPEYRQPQIEIYYPNLVGGPDGLSAEVLDRADNVWALSRFTMASSVARLVIFEQIYRAISILLGLPYHRGSN